MNHDNDGMEVRPAELRLLQRIVELDAKALDWLRVAMLRFALSMALMVSGSLLTGQYGWPGLLVLLLAWVALRWSLRAFDACGAACDALRDLLEVRR